jgi:hypothetical protein
MVSIHVFATSTMGFDRSSREKPTACIIATAA